MSMNIFRPRDYFYTSPIERYVNRALNQAFRDMDRALTDVAPYWIDAPAIHEVNIGNTIGEVVNDKEKFGVQLDVSQFRPDELTVNVRERDLIVEGHHEERSDRSGTIERHFVRKYTIPDDVQLESIQSELTDKGLLRINARKTAIEGPPSRKIPIQAAPRNEQSKSDHKE